MNDERQIVTVKQAYEQCLWGRFGAVLSYPLWEQHTNNQNERLHRDYVQTGKVYERAINPFADFDIIGIRQVTRGRRKGDYEITFSRNAGWAIACAGKEPFVKEVYRGDLQLRFTDACEWLPDEWYTGAQS